MKRIITAVVAAVGLLAAAALPANAGLGDVELSYILPEWEALDTHNPESEGYPGAWQEGLTSSAGESEITSFNTADLIISDRDNPNLGTSVEVADLGLEVEAGDKVYVTYVLFDGATAGGGAPRVGASIDGGTYEFGYPLDTTTDSGSIVLEIASSGTIGHFVIAFDNGSEGRVQVTAPRFVRTDGEDQSEVRAYFSEPPADEDHGPGPGEGNDDEGNGDADEPAENGPPHDGGQSVADEVKGGGAPPSHSNASDKAKGKAGGPPTGGHLP